jgi:murein DD-endopeptidase MepM/ murein hydrolase activator NlpD
VYATAEGKVTTAGNRDYFGKMVEIDHSNNCKTVYAHLQKYLVKAGNSVNRGELIGYIGNTGRSTGPHLHYEVRVNDKPLNPSFFILPHDIIVD